MKKETLICGIGINDSKENVTYMENGKLKRIPTYRKWNDMIHRVYSDFQLDRHPEYKDVTICSEWLRFSNFKKWMQEYPYNTKNKVLDKDIFIPGNRLYSPDTCVFVTDTINKLIHPKHRKGRELPTNVYKHRNKFKAEVRVDGKSIYLGKGDTPEEAKQLVNEYRSNMLMDIADEQKDHRVMQGLYRHAELLQFGTIDSTW